MELIWLVAMIGSPSAVEAVEAAPAQKIVVKGALPMGPALPRGAPAEVHPVQPPAEAAKLPPLPEHPVPPPGTERVLEAGDDRRQRAPMFPAAARAKSSGNVWILGAVGVVGAIALLAILLRRRRRR